jgi:hypothetical protein
VSVDGRHIEQERVFMPEDWINKRRPLKYRGAGENIGDTNGTDSVRTSWQI